VHRALDGIVPAHAPDADDIREAVGEGMVWRRQEGTYRLGRPADGSAGTVLVRDGVVLAHVHPEERLYGDARSELDHLRRRGLEVHVASGDRAERVARVGRTLDVSSTRAAANPLAKAEFVEELGAASTMFVGDGLNDLPALRAAACAGTPALHRPGLALRVHFSYLGEGVGAVRRVLAGADHVARAYRFNITFAVAYNAGAVALCLAGFITPVVAAILMPVSSAALVLVTTARAKRLEASWRS
jgi:Cu2+-exporting ATPase